MKMHATMLVILMGASVLASDASAQRRGSIYDPVQGPISPIADKTAHRVGDLLTVMIDENQDLKNEEKTDLAKNSSLNYQLLNFAVKPDAFSTLPALRTQKADSFGGAANYKRTGAFEARLTAMVVDLLPNGNMVIEGRREICIDKERKVLEFRGIVRRYDVTRANTWSPSSSRTPTSPTSAADSCPRPVSAAGLLAGSCTSWLHSQTCVPDRVAARVLMIMCHVGKIG